MPRWIRRTRLWWMTLRLTVRRERLSGGHHLLLRIQLRLQGLVVGNDVVG